MISVPENSNVSLNLKNSVTAARQISMLKEDALMLLAQLASKCGSSPIIELGPYIGGSTCALATAPNTRVITVELGGPNREHPQVPTDDTIADLKANLVRFGVRSRVEIIVGHFRRRFVFEAVCRQLAGQAAGMLFVDITPGTEIAIQQYVSLLRPDAYVVIDDYRSDHAVEKAAQVKAFVDLAVKHGFLKEIGVYGWGTWFGQLTGGEAIQRIMELPVSLPLWDAGGHAWYAFVGHETLADDISNTSPMELLEDDHPLGPAHTLHDTIRTTGLGAYSHWGEGLYFSTSDNSDPRQNGRRYSIKVNGAVWDLRSRQPFP